MKPIGSYRIVATADGGALTVSELAAVGIGSVIVPLPGAIADELGVSRVILPPHPGVASALGLLLSDVRYDLRRSWVRETARIRPADLRREVARLDREARGLLRGAGYERGRVDALVDMRYRGQAFELNVAAGDSGANKP